MKLVQFGAGNIGRSFIGQLFSQAGYEVVFIDIDPRIVQELNNKKKYRVIIKRNKEEDETLIVGNVRAVDGKKEALVIEEIAAADFVSTSVGKGALPFIMKNLAEGIRLHWEKVPEKPLDIIIAENIRNGSEYFRKELKKNLPGDFPLHSYVGLIETSIGKMVPIMREEDLKRDPLWVFAEPYNTLIVDRKGFKQPIPAIATILPVDNIQAYVDRKLFIHNLGHAAAAYFGFQKYPDAEYIYQILADENVYRDVRTSMEEAALALNRAYPKDLSLPDLEEHIEDLLERFQNRSLGDTIFRVGRDLYRKLDSSDRLIGAMILAKRNNLPCGTIARAVQAAINFRAGDEQGNLFPGDREFVEKEFSLGIDSILEKVCHLNASVPLEKAVIEEIKGS